MFTISKILVRKCVVAGMWHFAITFVEKKRICFVVPSGIPVVVI
jgi:hypothetical protein